MMVRLVSSSSVLLPLLVMATSCLMIQSQRSSGHSNNTPKRPSNIKLALINGGSEFFLPIEEGFLHQCKVMGIDKCYTRVGTDINETCDQHCAKEVYMKELVYEKQVDGIIMKPGSEDSFRVLLDEVVETSKTQVMFFDSDLENSTRIAYVGTDQVFLGQTMARLLRQLRPNGGTYAMIAQKEGRVDGFVSEITKYNDDYDTDQGHWYEIEKEGGWQLDQPPDGKWDYLMVMEQYLSRNRKPPDAFVFFRQTPMRHENYTQFIDKYRHLNITYIGTDGADYQLSYLNRNYVDGLVGQLPYEIGTRSVQVMTDILTNNEVREKLLSKVDENGTINTNGNAFYTNAMAYNVIPIELPPLKVEQNSITDQNLHSMGYTCFAIVAFSTLMCVAWTIYYRGNVIVKAAQPFFLLMVCCGVLIMGSSLVPLSLDDHGVTDPYSQIWDGVSQTNATYNEGELGIDLSLVVDEEEANNAENSIYLNPSYRLGICMSIPWLAFTGFTITFSALFSKTWRVNQLFNVVNSSSQFMRQSSAFQRVQVREWDVLVPFTILMSCNVIVLIAWTLMDPLIYTREEYEGTDYWNRVIATYGFCRASNNYGNAGVSSVLYYLIPLIFLNSGVLGLACYQAYQARDIQSEFAESKFIGLTLSSILQTFLTGFPIVFVVRDMPEAFYVVSTFMIFIVCMIVLLFIFVPKMYKQYYFATTMTPQEQRTAIQKSIHHSTQKMNQKNGSSSVGGSSSLKSPSGTISETGRTPPANNRSKHESNNNSSILTAGSAAFSADGGSTRSLGATPSKNSNDDSDNQDRIKEDSGITALVTVVPNEDSSRQPQPQDHQQNDDKGGRGSKKMTISTSTTTPHTAMPVVNEEIDDEEAIQVA